MTWQAVDGSLPAIRNFVWPHHVSTHRNLYEQILAGIAEARSDAIALAEHDVLYPDGYHDAMLAADLNGVCYNKNVWGLSSQGFFVRPNSRLLSNCCGRRSVLAGRIRSKLREIRVRRRVVWAEPVADAEFHSLHPTIDIRHGGNFTGDRAAEDGEYFSTIEYWGEASVYTKLFTRG